MQQDVLISFLSHNRPKGNDTCTLKNYETSTPSRSSLRKVYSLYLLTYLGLLQLEHRPSTIPLQRTRFWAASHAPFQLSFWALSSASVSRLQLLQGRPLLRFPWGFQLRACLVMLAGGFLSVWPIQPHFLWRICLASGSCPARSHKSVLLILSGHRMPRIRRRQVLTKHWIFWCNPNNINAARCINIFSKS